MSSLAVMGSKLLDDLFAEQPHGLQNVLLRQARCPVETNEHIGCAETLLVLLALSDALLRGAQNEPVLCQSLEAPAQFTRIAHRLVLLPLDVDGAIQLFEARPCLCNRPLPALGHERLPNDRQIRFAGFARGAPFLAEELD